MKPIAEMTDICLRVMKPNEIFTFEEWWQNVLDLPMLPHRKTYLFMKWATCTRGKVVQRINKELAARKKAERLVCVGNGKGLYLIDAKNIASFAIDKRVRSLISKIETTMSDWSELSNSPELSADHTRMLKAAVGWVEVNQSMMIGTLVKLPLQKATKNSLLKKLGINPNGKKKKKTAKRTKPPRRLSGASEK